MTISATVVQGVASTTIGTQDYTSPGFGTPNAAIVIHMAAHSGANPRADSTISVGFIDGTNENAFNASMNDGLSTTSTWRRSVNNGCTQYYDGSITVSAAAFDQWITDGVRLNWTTVSGNSDYVQVILFKDVLNAKAAVRGLVSGINDINDVGFKPSIVFVTCIGHTTGAGTTSQAVFSFGAANNSSSDVVSQGQIAFASQSGVSSSNCGRSSRDDSCCGQLTWSTQTWVAVAQDFDADGFTLNALQSPGSDWVGYFALQFSNPDDIDISFIDTPTSTGAQSYSQPGFTPGLVILGQTLAGTINNPDFGANIGYGIGVATDTEQYCSALSEAHGVPTTDNNNNFSLSAISEIYETPSTKRFDATLTGFTASGYTLNFTTTDTVESKKWMSIAFKGDAAPPAVEGNAIMFGANF